MLSKPHSCSLLFSLPVVSTRTSGQCRVQDQPMTPCLGVGGVPCGIPCAGPRCPPHQRAHKAKYNADHRRLRAAWAPTVATGSVTCWRCGELIKSADGWDLGHRGSLPSHPEHSPCNRGAH